MYMYCQLKKKINLLHLKFPLCPSSLGFLLLFPILTTKEPLSLNLLKYLIQWQAYTGLHKIKAATTINPHIIMQWAKADNMKIKNNIYCFLRYITRL